MSFFKLKKKLKSEAGQSLVEYLVIVALVAVGGIGIMRVVGQSINVNFAKVAKSLGASVSGKIANAEVKSSYYSKKNLRNFMNGSDTEKGKQAEDDGT